MKCVLCKCHEHHKNFYPEPLCEFHFDMAKKETLIKRPITFTNFLLNHGFERKNVIPFKKIA